MKAVIIILTLLITLTPVAHAQDDKTMLLDLIKTLAIISDKGEACNEHMNFFGKRALEGAVCKEFAAEFQTRLGSREEIRIRVLGLKQRLLVGELSCQDCEDIVQRIDELRISVTYFRDYMDFLKEEM